jgi:broad specificity phosphatase PhoE
LTHLLLVRHGLTEYNATRRFAGSTDIDLSQLGREQVVRLRERLADQPVDCVYCSDLQRARLTAEIVTEGRNLTIIPCSDLREVDYGECEGLTFSQIKERFPTVAEGVVAPEQGLEFPGGESFAAMVKRITRFKERLAGHAPNDTVLIVSHSGPLRSLVCSLLGISQGCWRELRIDNASLSIVDIYPRGTILSLLNGTSHLKGLPQT